MISKRELLRLGCGAAAAGIAVVSPVTVDAGRSLPFVTLTSAEAKSGNNGNGNGNGGGNDGGNGGGNGNSTGAGNTSNENGDGGSTDGGNSAKGAGSHSPSNRGAPGSGTKSMEGGEGAADVRHGNGIIETLRHGRYLMKDSRGRTIIDRQATAADYLRLAKYLR